MKSKGSAKQSTKKRSYYEWIIGIAVILLGAYFLLPGQSSREVRADDYVKGAASGRVTLIEYLDFECEACRANYPIIKQIANEFSGDLTIAVRYYPLPVHKNSITSARAAEAAGKQGKFWEMHDALFEGQSVWLGKEQADQDMFLSYAERVGLNMEQYKQDVTSNSVGKKINDSKRDGMNLGVKSTPTFFLNGQRIQNPKSIQEFRTLIQAEILKNPKVARGEKVHEHADYKVFINNKEISFSGDRYQSTTGAELDEAQHLHDNNGDNIHKHLSKNTLVSFFDSLGIILTDECIQMDTGEKYCGDGTNTLKFFVNDKEKKDFMQYEFKDLDRILISYGSESKEQIQTQLDTVTDMSCMYSDKCPERGKPPTENCVVGLGGDC